MFYVFIAITTTMEETKIYSSLITDFGSLQCIECKRHILLCTFWQRSVAPFVSHKHCKQPFNNPIQCTSLEDRIARKSAGARSIFLNLENLVDNYLTEECTLNDTKQDTLEENKQDTLEEKKQDTQEETKQDVVEEKKQDTKNKVCQCAVKFERLRQILEGSSPLVRDSFCSLFMNRILDQIHQVCCILTENSGKLFGGFVRDYFVPCNSSYANASKVREVHNNQFHSIENESIKSTILPFMSYISGLGSIVADYTSMYVPTVQQDFRDIDVWFTQPEQWNTALGRLKLQGFTVAAGSWADGKTGSCPEFALTRVAVSRDNITLFLDVVCSPVLPVNDFSCNTLSLQFDEQHNPVYCAEVVLGIDTKLKQMFTSEELIQQIVTKQIYLLPTFLFKPYHQRYVDPAQHVYRRIADFKNPRGFTILDFNSI